MNKIISLSLMSLGLILTTTFNIDYNDNKDININFLEQGKYDSPIFSHEYLGNEMPILAMINPTSSVHANPSFTTTMNYQIYKDAGFNMVLPCYERPTFKEDEVRKSLEICEDLKLVYIVNEAEIRCSGSEGINSTIEYYKDLLINAWYNDYESFGGIASKDEPNADDFNEIAKGVQAFNSVYSDKLFHSTLLPQYATHSQLHVPDYSSTISHEGYEVYVKNYVEIVKPQLLAYDFYLWHTIPNPTLDENSTRDYFWSLSLFRNYSLELNIPFWVTFNTFKHAYTIEDKQYPLKELEWIVNTSLAYGTKGLQYYTYWPTMEDFNDSYLETPLRNAMVTSTGVPTDTYYKIQHINNNVKYIDEILMASNHKGIMQFGDYKNDIVKKDLLKQYGPLTNITGGDAFVGCFEHNGNYVYYIVNNSINTGDQLFMCNFNKKVDVTTMNLDSRTKKYENTYSIGVNLSAGEAILVEVEV